MLQFSPCLSTIDLARDIPILVQNGVEMITINDYPLFLDAPQGRLVEIRRTFESAGIEAHSVHAPQDSLIAFDIKARTKAVETCKKLLCQLSAAGVGILVFHIGAIEHEKHRASAFSMVLDSLHSLAESAEQCQVILALENDPPGLRNRFPRPLCSNSSMLLKLLEKVNSRWLRACYDTGHGHIGERTGETIGQAIRNLSDWIVTIHMQDNEGFGDLHLQPGYGTINWDEFVEALKDIGYDHPITIESGPWAGGTFRCMLNEVKALLKDSGADIPEELTLRPKADWLKNFPSGWTTHGDSDLMIRCRRCGHYIVWTPEGGHCTCSENA